MKRILSITGILGLAFLFMSAITILEAPQDPPKKKKTQKHIKMVKVEDGKKVELDTIIEADKVLIWKGDTIEGGKKLKWMARDGFKMDSLHKNKDMDFEFEIDEDEGGNVFILKSGKDGEKMVKEFKMNGDAKFNVFTDKEKGDKDIMMWHSDKGNNEMIFNAPNVAGIPHPPHAPNFMFVGKGKKGNVIDLSDSGIISFKKKKMSGGREKITIIRNQVKDEEIEVEEEHIIHGNGNHPVIWNEAQPGKNRSVKIIKRDGGKVEVIEDEEVWSVKEGDANVKVIKEGGHLIHIKELKEGDGKKVEVKVEVEEETENEKKQ